MDTATQQTPTKQVRVLGIGYLNFFRVVDQLSLNNHRFNDFRSAFYDVNFKSLNSFR